jgi:N-methylhydantoinase A
MSSYRVGVDIGGTFTDIVFMDAGGRIHTKKISSSVDNYARSIADGLAELFSAHGLSGEDVAEIRHGTTVASNAILERKGARTGLITSKGFRDVLEIRTLRMPRLYDIAWSKPPALVERYLRRVVDERIDGRGNVERALDPRDAEAAVRALLDEGVEAIAVCLINSFANPAHEYLVKAAIEKLAPDLPHCISYEVLPEIKEYERTSTTVVNTYVMPIVGRYLAQLRRDLDRTGLAAPLYIMQSNGGLMSDGAAQRMPCHIIESGPAAGVVGAQALARRMGVADIVSFDMGGTTAKASLVERGEVTRTQEYQVGAGIMIGSRLMTGGGYALKVPAIDLAEVGAGGGSLVWMDRGGALQIGPESAGAQPGPLCYGKGGTEPTVTDANLILGYLNPEYLVGGELTLDKARAESVFKAKVADPLGLSLERAAHGAHLVAAANMIRAIKAVSTERGRDVRDYALFAFGGNGPMFAGVMARQLGMRHIIIPPSPGLFSAFGLLYADVEHHHSRTFRRLTREADLDELNAAWDTMAREALERLAGEGFTAEHARLRRAAAMHYQGQIYELNVPVPEGRLDRAALTALDAAFGDEHERSYGHKAGPEEPVEIVSIQVVAQGIREEAQVPDTIQSSRGEQQARPAAREAYFGPAIGWLTTPVLRRGDIAAGIDGPAIVEEYDATCVVPPHAKARVDDYGNILIELADE